MTTPDRTTGDTEQIQAMTAELDRHLRRMHLSPRDRRTIVDEIRADLQNAAAEGANPETLVGPDMEAFARETVTTGGFQPRPGHYPRVVAGGLLAAGAVAVAGYLLIEEVLQPAFASWFTLHSRYPVAGPVVVFAAIALTGVLGTLAALKWLLNGRHAGAATLARAAVLLPIGAAAGIAAAVAVASDPGDPSTPATVTLQALFVVTGAVLALAAARWWAVRITSDHDDPASRLPAWR